MMKNRLNQTISEGGAEIEHLLPKLERRAIADV